MSAISQLVTEGMAILSEMNNTFETNGLSPKLVVDAKALHTKGRFLLQKIDKATYQDYCALFSKTTDQVGDWHKWGSYLIAELEKCVGILAAVDASGNEAVDKSLVRVFISHGKFTVAFSKLETFLRSLGCLPHLRYRRTH